VEAWDAITSRRNVRNFDDRPVPDHELDRILEAGRRSPSSQNRQPWDFIVVTDREQLTELAKLSPGAGPIAGSAATIAIVLPESDAATQRDRNHYDAGQATMMMMIAAADLGVGSGHAAVRDQDTARRLLAFPPEHYAAYLISLGYPAGRPLRPIRAPARRRFEEVVHRGHW